MPKCKKCGSEATVKNGVVAGKQRYRCKECGYNFREGDNRTNEKMAAKKALRVLLYAMAKGSFRMIGRILEIDYTLAYRWIRSFGESLPEPEAPGDITQMAFDEMWRFIGSKNKLWIIKAIDRRTRRTVAWVLGNRDTATFRRLYEKIRHLKGCAFYADDWDACAKVLPSERHVIGKAHTIDIEHDNSNTRHHLGEDLHDEQKSFRKKNG